MAKTSPDILRTGRRAAAKAPTPRPLPQTRKGKMRRDMLKAATAELLKEFSYHELTLDRITAKADIPLSVFYHYFNTKKELVLELIEEVFVEFETTVTSQAPHGTWERGLQRSQLSLLTLFSANIGLMRCLYEVEDRAFSQRWREKIGDWHRRMAISLGEFTSESGNDPDELFAIIEALGGMTNEFAYQYLVVGNARLKATFPDLESAAEFLNALWMRALFLQHPTRLASRFRTLQGLHDFDTQTVSAQRSVEPAAEAPKPKRPGKQKA